MKPLANVNGLIHAAGGGYQDQTSGGWMCLTYAGIACCGCCAFERVEPNEELVVLYWGNYQKTISTTGEHFLPSCGRHYFRVSTKQQTLSIPKAVVTDSDGSNLLLDAMITWKVDDSAKAAIVVSDYYEYIRSQGEVVMRKVAARNSYHNMKTDAEHVAHDMRDMLQNRVHPAGILVISMDVIYLYILI